MTTDPNDPIPYRRVRDARPGEVYQPLFDGPPPFPGDSPVEQHAARQLHPGAPAAIAAAARALLDLAWTWARTKLRRKPEPTFHEAWCDNPDRCECWRFLLESDPTAERMVRELDDDQRYDR